MLQPHFTEEEIDQLYRLFMEHPSGAAKKKLHVVYLKALGLPHQDIVRIARVSGDSVTRYLKAYIEGGVTALCSSNLYCPRSALQPHSAMLKTHFQTHPPHTVAQAAHEIERLTGIKLGLSACRDFMRKRLGMKCRKMAAIPSKADPDKQREFLHTTLEFLLEQEQQGKRRVFFVDAAHFVMQPFLGFLWCFVRQFIPSPSGRKRFNVLGALHATTLQVVTFSNDSYINSYSVVKLICRIAVEFADLPITLVMDNARYQHCRLVMDLATALGIELLFLPPYSPNLNLIERLWKFVKKKCLYSEYYETFTDFKQAIMDCIAEADGAYKQELASLLTLRFQTFENVTL